MQNRNLSLWDAAAEKFREIQSGSVHSEHNYAYVKQLLPMLAPAGKRVLDAGCGYGGYSRIFLDAGAAVTMLDGSAEMLRLAAESCPEAEAVQATLEQPLPFADGSFDICFCNQVLMDLPDISLFFPEAARVLVHGGRLFASIVHPCFYDAPLEQGRTGQPRFQNDAPLSLAVYSGKPCGQERRMGQHAAFSPPAAQLFQRRRWGRSASCTHGRALQPL